MKILRTLEPDKLRNLLTLFSSGMLFWISTTILLPVMPAYIKDVGATTQQVGLVMGCFAIGLLLSRTKLGHLADHRGRKIVVLIGTFVVGVAPVGYLFAHSIPTLMVLRAFHGISLAAFTTGYNALVVDLSPPKQRGELIGYMSLVIPFGMALGPALGGILTEATSYATVFLFAAVAGVLSFNLASRVKEDNKRRKSQPKGKGNSNIPRLRIWHFCKMHHLRVPAMVLLLIGLVFGMLVSFLPLYIRETGLDFNAGLFYTAAAIASFVMRVFVGRASDIYGRGLFITSSLVFYIISMLLLSFGQNSLVLIISAIAEGIGAGVLIPMTIALMSDRSLAQERAQIYAFCIGGFDLGIGMAGPMFGYLASTFTYRDMFFLAAILASCALTIFLTLSSKNLIHSLRFAAGRERDFYALD